ncbi:hypothetical protein R75471_04162 [Paraburkholderia domus]|uniref:phage tail sheath family protein n=1 Tax=Paraburkholderia domus TaxID=2793075 RepID=UPI001B03AAE6|nr:phage tail sheath C-terminal domain-containing protein [Paraburkholderia domus]CAE6920757.1 hypothetical protein R75471_04162 [Paraburkholderia domus]
MSVTTSYPGVYVDEQASMSMSVNNAPTAVPVFIGLFNPIDGSTAPPSQCVRIANWLDFSSRFSLDADLTVNITSSVVSADDVEDPENQDSSYSYSDSINCVANQGFYVRQYFENGGGPCYLLSYDDNDAEINAFPAAISRETDITLIVAIGGGDKEYSSLSTLLVDGNGYFLIGTSGNGLSGPPTQKDLTAAYYPNVHTPYFQHRPQDSAIVVNGYVDAAASAVKNLADLKSINSTLYDKVSADIDDKLAEPLTLNPTGAIAGVYCSVDSRRGVWAAPANVALAGVTGVTEAVSDDAQGSMNDAGINVLRNFAGRGVVVWGARTMAGATSNSDTSWRYISVRRFFNSAERDIKKAMQPMVFEPNSEPTWEKVRSAIENYLHSLWRQGALLGATAKEAYFVKIGNGITMTDDDIAQGKMIVDVGMAAVRPAEFIILQFTQNLSS